MRSSSTASRQPRARKRDEFGGESDDHHREIDDETHIDEIESPLQRCSLLPPQEHHVVDDGRECERKQNAEQTGLQQTDDPSPARPEPLPENVEADMVAVAVDERVGQKHAPDEHDHREFVRPGNRGREHVTGGDACEVDDEDREEHGGRHPLRDGAEAGDDRFEPRGQCRSTSCRRCVAADPGCHFCDSPASA